MCTNAALDRMECYMDQLIDSFEDFVKKSLIMISVAIGSVLLLLAYIFRVMMPQPPPRRSCNQAQAVTQCSREIMSTIPQINTRCSSRTSVASNTRQRRAHQECGFPAVNKSSSELKDKQKVDTPVQFSNKPSENEMFVKEMGYSNCSKSCITHHKTEQSSNSRTVVPSLPPCMFKCAQNKRRCSPPRSRTSCCSLCCVDNDKR